VTSKVKGRGRKVTWSVSVSCWPISGERHLLRGFCSTAIMSDQTLASSSESILLAAQAPPTSPINVVSKASVVRARDGFEDRMFEAKAKAMPDNLEAKARPSRGQVEA